MRIVELKDLPRERRDEAARVLRASIPGPSYAPPGAAEAEVGSFVVEGAERFAFAAVAGEALCGWVGGIRDYSHALELHPLVVGERWRRRGVGRALVEALEARAAAEGILTIYLGADDETGGTSLFGVDLFPNALEALTRIEPTPAGHPFFFYRRLGYEPIGVLPDASGRGKPDIFMGKRIALDGSRR
jgi:aminoglycoside 6'-N-acetyltransferase I